MIRAQSSDSFHACRMVMKLFAIFLSQIVEKYEFCIKCMLDFLLQIFPNAEHGTEKNDVNLKKCMENIWIQYIIF